MDPANSTNPNPTELTGALPLWTAGVCVDEDGQAQQTALGLGGVVATVKRRVVKQQLPVKTDQLSTFIDTVGVRRLRTRRRAVCTSKDARVVVNTDVYFYTNFSIYIHMQVYTGVVSLTLLAVFAIKKKRKNFNYNSSTYYAGSRG